MKHKRYTMRDIALACGVSTATVSYVLNDTKTQSISAETKNRVLHYAHLVGYELSSSARALATGRSGNVGIYVPHPGNDRGKRLLMRALAEEAERSGLHTLLLTDQCLRRRVSDVDAIFAIDVSEAEFHAIGQNSFVPLLCLDGRIEDMLFYSFFFDPAALRRRAEALSGRGRVFLVADEPHNEHYAAGLHAVFDGFLAPCDFTPAMLPSDAAALSQEPLPGCLCMGSTEFPLPFDAYAQAAMQTALRAIARIDPPLEHIHPIG